MPSAFHIPDSFDDLSDVSISSPAQGDIPVYNTVTQKWENQAGLSVSGFSG